MTLSGAQRTRLGLFLLTGMLLLGGTLFGVLGSTLFAEVDLYSVRFKESVSGLETSSQVKYQGLRVGRVHSLRIAADEPGAIEVTLALKPGTVLYQGTEARLDSSALTGLTTINLSPGDPRKSKLTPGVQLPAGMSFTDRITGQADAIRIKFETLTNQLIRWTGDSNRARFEHLLDDTHKLVKDLDATVVALRPALLASARSVEDAGRGAVRLAHAGTRTLRSTQDVVRSTGARTQAAFNEVDRILKGVDVSGVAQTLTSAQATLRKIDAAVGRVDLTGAIKGVDGAIRTVQLAIEALRKLLTGVELAVRGGRDDAIKSLKHLRAATEDLRTFSRDIARDPALLLRGRETR